ncbi:MAG TPA: dTMP kinase [Syntrophorhabdaceae bacterium]|nr:dTMP kinase [Syntrophorhabdaceae bacterium]
MLITFEGIEGSGKTTQIELLYNYLIGKKKKVIKTREPGGTPFGEILRKVFLHEHMEVYPLSELLVFMAMRAQHVEQLIRPALKEHKIVLCDRFVDASYAYQGYGRGIDLGIIETLNRFVTKGIRPNLTILLDCPVKEGLGRKARAASMDRFEKEDLSFHRKIRKAYEKLSKEDPKRFFVIKGTLDKNTIQMAIRKKVEELFTTYGI